MVGVEVATECRSPEVDGAFSRVRRRVDCVRGNCSPKPLSYNTTQDSIEH